MSEFNEAMTRIEELCAKRDDITNSELAELGNLLISNSASIVQLGKVAKEMRKQVGKTVPAKYIEVIDTFDMDFATRGRTPLGLSLDGYDDLVKGKETDGEIP